MTSNSNPVRLIVFSGLIATTAVVIASGLGVQAQNRDIEQATRQRFRDIGTTYTHTVARIAEQYLGSPARYPIELFALAQTSRSITGSIGVTISAASSGSSRDFESIWASSEPRYRTASGELRYEPGRTRIQDELSPHVGSLIAGVNRDAESGLSDLTPRIEAVTRSILDLLMRNPSADQAELAEVDEVFRVLYQSGADRLADITRDWAALIPSLETGNELPDEVLFFHPIATIDRSGDSYYAGMVRFRRSTETVATETARLQASRARAAFRRTAVVLTSLWMALGVMIATITVKRLSVTGGKQ